MLVTSPVPEAEMHTWRTAWLLLAAFLFAGCRDVSPHPQPEFHESRIVVEKVDRVTSLVHGDQRVRLYTLDPDRVVRLTRIMFLPEAPLEIAVKLDAGAVVKLDTPETARAFMQAVPWVDALILARRKLTDELGTDVGTDASVVAETVRRYLMVDPPVEPPDWGAMSRALDNADLWAQTPQTAGVGALVLAGILITQRVEGPTWERAGKLLSRVAWEDNMPPWLSVVAYTSWSRRDFAASEDRQ
jgi:hypothetical protein